MCSSRRRRHSSATSSGVCAGRVLVQAGELLLGHLVHAVKQLQDHAELRVAVGGEQVGPGGGQALVVGGDGGQRFGQRLDDHAAAVAGGDRSAGVGGVVPPVAPAGG